MTALVQRTVAALTAHHQLLCDSIIGLETGAERQQYAVVVLLRLLTVAMLQQRGWLGDRWYLQNQFGQSLQQGAQQFFLTVWQPLCFDGLADLGHNPAVGLGRGLKYLGGPFLPHALERQAAQQGGLGIADEPFAAILDWLGHESWQFSPELPSDNQTITLPVLADVLESWVNQQAGLAYVTPQPVVTYLCDRTLNQCLLQQINAVTAQPVSQLGQFLQNPDPPTSLWLLNSLLPRLAVLDPACGSGKLLLALLQRLTHFLVRLIQRLPPGVVLPDWVPDPAEPEAVLVTAVQRQILSRNLYGVDQLPVALEIARTQLQWHLLATQSQPHPLPDLGVNLLSGNALIGLIRVDEQAADPASGSDAEARQGNLLQPLAAQDYRSALTQRRLSLERYRGQSELLAELAHLPASAQSDFLRQRLADIHQQVQPKLDLLLLREFSQKLGIRYRQPRHQPPKRLLTPEDMADLHPVHWGYHFQEIIEDQGGFDVVVTLPPWGTLSPTVTGFCQAYDLLLKSQGFTPEEFRQQRQDLLAKNSALGAAWEQYQSQCSYLTDYFRSADQYSHQRGAEKGNRPRLDWLFLEQCLNLLRPGGFGGLVLDQSFWQHDGAADLRDWLQAGTALDPVACCRNTQELFPQLSKKQQLCLVSFAKGGTTAQPRLSQPIETVAVLVAWCVDQADRPNALAI